jgi:hypothetical protein
MTKNSNSDWNHPVQSNPDLGREKLKKDSSGLAYPQPKSILDRVEKASQVDSGFAGKLPPSE